MSGVDDAVTAWAASGLAALTGPTDGPPDFSRAPILAAATDLAPGVPIHHRDHLDRIQRELRERPGVSVLIYDQTCATEARRRRKRGKLPAVTQRVFINEAVCEGCGDCGVKSFCVSVLPKETEYGRKRDIDQSNCNKDFSCVEGFCPSFVTVHGGQLRKGNKVNAADRLGDLPMPAFASALDRPWNILITGVGGTGVVTIGALLGMAGHLEGKGATVLDQTGLAQKGGAVTTHIRLARTPALLKEDGSGTSEPGVFPLGCVS